jgi:hypothetical protein
VSAPLFPKLFDLRFKALRLFRLRLQHPPQFVANFFGNCSAGFVVYVNAAGIKIPLAPPALPPERSCPS